MKIISILLNVLVLVNFECYGFMENSKLNPNQNIIGSVDPAELTSNYWYKNGQDKVLEQLRKRENHNIAKNIIFFMGDGMSIPTITAARIYKGQLENRTGEDSKLHFETFPYVGLSKTYCVNNQVADSACSATAYLCDVKANFGTVGVSAQVLENDCPSAENVATHVSSIADWAQKAGKGTGIVTTTRVTHASPSGNYAHVANREYESDADIATFYNGTGKCHDIAYQLIRQNTGINLNVIMGGGRKKLLPQNFANEQGFVGERLDNLNLIDEWKSQKNCLNASHKFVYNKETLKSVDYENTDYILGLFNDDHLDFHLDADSEVQPTLAEMTEAAIKTLRKHNNGFYLFVEGGHIDTAHHWNLAYKALDEVVEFDKAIEVAEKLTSRDDTLIVVTADHAHVMTLSGYSNRGSNVLGLNSLLSDKDDKPYVTLSYANGPGHIPYNGSFRPDLSNFSLNKNIEYPAGVPLNSETHGGDDTGVFANGPWAHLFAGVYEQNVLPHLIGYASCVGNGVTACNQNKSSKL